MAGQSETKAEPPPRRSFQFGMKVLFVPPVLLAMLFAADAYLEQPPGGSLIALIWAVLLGSCYWLIHRTRKALRESCILVSIILLLTFLLRLPEKGAIEAPRRSQCSNNLKQIVLALHDYHDAYGSFPPSYIADENGRPMHSWRVLILPFMEQESLYDQYDFNEPWDGPNNRKLAESPLRTFNCPSDKKEPSTMTNYVVVVGPETAWPGADRPQPIRDFSDGTSNTLLVVEVADSGIHWMEPRDLHVLQMAPNINPEAGQGISSRHPGGAEAAFADGTVHFLAETLSAEQLRALLTPAGGEEVSN